MILTRDQVRSVDRIAIEEYGIPGVVLMENAGRGVAELIAQRGVNGPVVVCCGSGNNGGDGFVIARHLVIRGHAVQLVLATEPSRIQGDAAINFEIVKRMQIPTTTIESSCESSLNAAFDILRTADWIVDCLLGTGARGAPRSPMHQIIEAANVSSAKRLAVDLPSGVDCDSGEVASIAFRATETCTFVSPKPCMEVAACMPFIGRLTVIDIGVPKSVIDQAAQPTT